MTTGPRLAATARRTNAHCRPESLSRRMTIPFRLAAPNRQSIADRRPAALAASCFSTAPSLPSAAS